MHQRPISKDSKLSPLDSLSSYKNNTNKYKFRSILNGIDRLSTLPTQNLKNTDFEVTKPYFFTYKGRCDIANCKCQYHRLKRPFGSQHITHHKKSIKQKNNFANRQQKIPIINSLNRKKMQRTTIPSRLVKDKSHQILEQLKSHKQHIKKVKLRQKLQNWNESFEQFLRTHDLQILKQRKNLDSKQKSKQSKQLPQNIIIKLLKNNLHKPSNQMRLMLRQLCMDNGRIQHYMIIFEKMKSNYKQQITANKQNFDNNLRKKITKKAIKAKDDQNKNDRNVQEEEFQQQKKKIIKNIEGKNGAKIANIIKNLRKSDLDKLKLSLAEFIKSLIANNQQNSPSRSSETMTQFLADFTRIIFGETKKVRRVESKMKNIFRNKQKEEPQKEPDIILEQANVDQQVSYQKNYLRPQSQRTKTKGSDRSLLGSYRLSSKVDHNIIGTSLNRVSVSSIDSSSNEDLDHIRATKKTKKTYKIIKLQQNEDQPQLADTINWQNYNQLELSQYQNSQEVQILPKTEKTEELLSKFHKYNNKRLATIFDLQIQRNRKVAKKIQKILRRCGFQKTIIQEYDSLVTVKRKIKVLKEISEQPQFKTIRQQFEKYLHIVEERYYFGKYKTIISKKINNNSKNTPENDHENIESILKQLKQNYDNELKHYFVKQVPLKNPVEQEEILLSFPSNLSHIINQQKPIKVRESFPSHQRKKKQTQVALVQKQLDDKLEEIGNESLNYKIFNPNKTSLSLVKQNCRNYRDRRQSIKKCFRFTKQNYPDTFKDLLYLANNSKTNSLFDMSIS